MQEDTVIWRYSHRDHVMPWPFTLNHLNRTLSSVKFYVWKRDTPNLLRQGRRNSFPGGCSSASLHGNQPYNKNTQSHAHIQSQHDWWSDTVTVSSWLIGTLHIPKLAAIIVSKMIVGVITSSILQVLKFLSSYLHILQIWLTVSELISSYMLSNTWMCPVGNNSY